MAMAPPLGLTCSAASARPRSRVTATACAANASLSSITSIWESSRPAFANTFFVAGAGAKPMIRGATPAAAVATTLARGVKPCRRAAAADASSIATAPSLIPDALPAVTVPFGSPPVSASRASRGWSQAADARPRRWSGRLAVLLRHAARARSPMRSGRRRARRAALLRAQRERVLIPRATANSAATFSAVPAIESMP